MVREIFDWDALQLRKMVWEAPEMVWEAPKLREMVWEALIRRLLNNQKCVGILVGKLEASKKPARGQQRPARGQQQASKTPARTSKRPARG